MQKQTLNHITRAYDSCKMTLTMLFQLAITLTRHLIGHIECQITASHIIQFNADRNGSFLHCSYCNVDKI